MANEICTRNPSGTLFVHAGIVPAVIAQAGPRAAERFIEFFTANIRNTNTRLAYVCAVGQFLQWCECHGFALKDLRPTIMAGYIEQLSTLRSAPTVKQWQ